LAFGGGKRREQLLGAIDVGLLKRDRFELKPASRSRLDASATARRAHRVARDS
jgi:hypothetical protein